MSRSKGEGFSIQLGTHTISKPRPVVTNILSEWCGRRPPDEIVKTYPVIWLVKDVNIVGEIPLKPILLVGAGLIGAAVFALLR